MRIFTKILTSATILLAALTLTACFGGSTSEPSRYYMLAVAHLNPDRLSFDDVADDYFRQGFGPAAAAMREYWDAVEKMFNEAAATSKEARESRKFYHYHRHLRFEPLDAAIAKARERAAGDELLLARIRYFASALDLAKIEHRIVEAFDRDDLAADEAAVLE